MIDQKKASQLARAGFDLWQAGQLEESSAKYREALECADPEHYALEDYHGEFAAVLATLGRDTEARQQYELALAKAERGDRGANGPGVSVARYFLGEHLLKMNEPAAALEIVHAVADSGSRQDWLLGMVEAKALWNNRPLHLTAPGPAHACPLARGAIVDSRVPQVSGRR